MLARGASSPLGPHCWAPQAFLKETECRSWPCSWSMLLSTLSSPGKCRKLLCPRTWTTGKPPLAALILLSRQSKLLSVSQNCGTSLSTMLRRLRGALTNPLGRPCQLLVTLSLCPPETLVGKRPPPQQGPIRSSQPRLLASTKSGHVCIAHRRAMGPKSWLSRWRLGRRPFMALPTPRWAASIFNACAQERSGASVAESREPILFFT